MKAFHNDLKIKRKYLARIKAHAKIDELIKGTYWEKGKGCAIGCTIHSGDHASYETELGIPRRLALLEDVLFEGLPKNLAKKWPTRFLKAIPVGADLSKVWNKFAIWLLLDEKNGILQYAHTEKSKLAILNIANLYLRNLKEKEEISDLDWKNAHGYVYTAVRENPSNPYNSVLYSISSSGILTPYKTYSISYINQSEKLLELLKNPETTQ